MPEVGVPAYKQQRESEARTALAKIQANSAMIKMKIDSGDPKDLRTLVTLYRENAKHEFNLAGMAIKADLRNKHHKLSKRWDDTADRLENRLKALKKAS